jgi:hypothetical protein
MDKLLSKRTVYKNGKILQVWATYVRPNGTKYEILSQNYLKIKSKVFSSHNGLTLCKL